MDSNSTLGIQQIFVSTYEIYVYIDGEIIKYISIIIICDILHHKIRLKSLFS